jgi:hypothetical protein
MRIASDIHVLERRNEDVAEGNNVLVLEVLQQFQFSVSSLG